MNGFKSASNGSFIQEPWFRERLKSLDIENDLFRAETSPDFLSACTSFLHLRLQEKLGGDEILESDVSQLLTKGFPRNIIKKKQFSNFDRSTSFLNFGTSCIKLKNVDEYSQQFENEISKTSILKMEQILPIPMENVRTPIFQVFKSTSQSKFQKFRNFITRFLNKKQSRLKFDTSGKEFITIATQTDVSLTKIPTCGNTFVSTMLRTRSSSMTIPEEIKEYQCWKQKYNRDMEKKRCRYYQFPYKYPMRRTDSCLEYIETKVKTKKVTKINKLRRQNSKLSVCNEEYESEDEYEAYWNKLGNQSSRRFLISVHE